MTSNTQVAIRDETGLDTVLIDIQNMQKMAGELLKTKHYQTLGEAGIFAVSQKAKALNMNVLGALNGDLYYLNGKVGMPAETMSAMIRSQGHSITKDPKSDDKVCILHGKRKDNGDTWTSKFSIEDAKRAGLLKNMYEKYIEAMLYNRAMSFLARQLFSDVIKGAGYTYEELLEIKDNKLDSIPHLHETTVEVIEEKKLISSEQVQQIQDLLKGCPKDFIVNVSKYVVDSFGGFDKIEEKAFTPILGRIQSKLDEVQKANAEMTNAA